MARFPLSTESLKAAVHHAWNDLYRSSIGKSGLRIGQDIFLPAQATGVILERLIGVFLRGQDNRWRSGHAKIEKDVVYTADDKYSFEIKTSSSPNGVYGNRSTGHRSQLRKKVRTGYHLVINYKLPTETDGQKYIRGIRFGWLDDEDWVGQAEPTGQQASVSAQVRQFKLISIN